MSDTQTVIILLSIIVTILSIMAITVTVAIIFFLIRIKRIIDRVDDTTAHAARVIEWLSPAKIISEIVSLLNKNKE